MKLRIVVTLIILGITMTAVQCLAEEICACVKPNGKSARFVDDVSECKGKETPQIFTTDSTCDGELVGDGRWCDQGDGTIKDMTTGLVWLQDANYFEGLMNWQSAMDAADGLTFPNDPAGYTDWRLPTIKELESLIDYSEYDFALPSGHPFNNVQSDYYWSGTTYAYNISHAWNVYMLYGHVYHSSKIVDNWVWPVRGGND